ncbi:MAG: glycosyltransferase [Bacteroidetes bacterium]|nr:glycosyltransferase [Bacteroidota bacterium]
MPKYSIIIPVYNRPDELKELLDSLTRQTFRNFEVIVVDDGSRDTSREVSERYVPKLSIQYFFKPNSGPGPSRNFGFEHARGSYLVMFDSDCIVPEDYFEWVEKYMEKYRFDAWGGPDRGHESFTSLQRAMAFTMSSFLTTGGIRGGGNQAAAFQPRSFNMGVSRAVWEHTGGFRFDRSAEDIEWSIRIRRAGFKIHLIPDAFVYHKRRTDFAQFFQQVRQFGNGRAQVGKVYPAEVKPTHWFPAVFLTGLMAIPFLLLLAPDWGELAVLLLTVYLMAIFTDALIKTHSIEVAFLSIPSSIIQLCGYGIGFIKGMLGSRHAL